MPLAPGLRVGTYEIQSLLGVGGMGEVYRARDTTLNRDIALKVLPEAFTRDPDQLARFRREAHVLASLNHPNIASIYGFEESTGVQALVLELVEGPTLADRIRKGPIPLDESLRIASQIAEALEAAHTQGIVHRDLKPANIKITPAGVVKVLDFGIAKIDAAEPGFQHLSESPTLTASGTRVGIILGTTAYMSPEQARGQPIDKRTDIWAFGCVLFEMLSGRLAFDGDTVSDTIAKILEREPEWRVLPASTPKKIRDLLRRCVQKDLPNRLRDISAAQIDIDDARTRRSGGRNRFRLLMIPAAITLALVVVWWAGLLPHQSSSPTPETAVAPTQREPVSILMADLQNGTNDPAFDRTLEPMLKRALEGAGFINAVDRSRTTVLLGVKPPDRLDDLAARKMALEHGFAVVLSGSLGRRGDAYDVSLKATQAVTGTVIADATDRASNKDQVLTVAMRLVTRVRTALGDAASESAQMRAMASLSATSLEVARQYAVATQALFNNKFEDARESALKAVALDPGFGAGYLLLATASRNLHQWEDAEKYLNEALGHLDGMTERERLATRGLPYRTTADYVKCVQAYSELIALYPADVIGHNQIAFCASQLRDLGRARDELRTVVAILPKHRTFRINLALDSSYAGDFAGAEREARAVEKPDAYSALALAFAQLGQGHLSEARDTFQGMEKLPGPSATISASGLGDLAAYEGRFSEAVRILQQGAAADVASKNPDHAAAKFAKMAYAQLWQGQDALARATADKAILSSTAGTIRFLAARVFVEAGDVARARTEAARLSLGTFESRAEPEAYARIIEAEIALKNRDTRQAIKLLTEANALVDTWLGHFDLGRAYLEVPALAQADAEFQRCISRRGETLALFLDEEPTYGFFPPVYYYQGLVHDELKKAGAASPTSAGQAEPNRAYLDIRGKSSEDPLVREVRRRAGR